MKQELADRTLNLQGLDASTLLDSLPDGVYITDKDRRILFWNREAENMTGWSREEVVGHCCHENILCHIDKDGHRLCGQEHCPLHRAIVTNTSSDLPSLIFAKRRDGRRIPVEVTVSPIRNAEGQVIGGIEVFRDLSPAFEDLNRARLIQQEAMGMNLPDDNRVDINVRYTPHDQVGGDFYRVECLRRDVYAILLADVVGHGISAALYAMELRSLWEGGRSRLEQPAEFLLWLSRRVEPLTDQGAGYFATALQLLYHADTGRLEIGTAGHPPPLIVRRDGRMESLQPSGPGLGMFPQPVFKTVTTQLDPGEHLLLFTDGALEILNESGDELDEEGFFDLVRTTDLNQGAEGLLQLEVSLLKYSNKLALPDDMTLILLRRLG